MVLTRMKHDGGGLDGLHSVLPLRSHALFDEKRASANGAAIIGSCPLRGGDVYGVGSRWGHCWSTFLRTLYFGARHPWFEGKGARTWTGSLRTAKPESMNRSMVLRPWDRRLAQWLRSKTARHSRFLLVSAWCAGVRRPSKRREEVPEMLRSRHGCLLGQGLVRGERSIWGASRCRHDLVQEPSAVPSRDVMPSSRQ
ncbi:hypothetical protein VFPFJ_02747 [Purpureocillium lilacinum]|uniref:Uncharacterized protein n=1 Tax=Purpureocillium lilacinum TaxID=33203 RepID=A0A179GMV8_PURLI|nr:hypothetical protein VFPFJ_02747 [Purpureocillium lilacinum]OAQ78671.1 hypothetical protein VFPBJ_06792 [Purpureocillium lilacinum]OAQ93585.1 hypothetical protein VFPFJ_02747 [Purpureocillium lilacinum]